MNAPHCIHVILPSYYLKKNWHKISVNVVINTWRTSLVLISMQLYLCCQVNLNLASNYIDKIQRMYCWCSFEWLSLWVIIPKSWNSWHSKRWHPPAIIHTLVWICLPPPTCLRNPNFCKSNGWHWNIWHIHVWDPTLLTESISLNEMLTWGEWNVHCSHLPKHWSWSGYTTHQQNED